MPVVVRPLEATEPRHISPNKWHLSREGRPSFSRPPASPHRKRKDFSCLPPTFEFACVCIILVSGSGPGSYLRPLSRQSIAVQIGFNAWASTHSLVVTFLDRSVIWNRRSLRARDMFKPSHICELIAARANWPARHAMRNNNLDIFHCCNLGPTNLTTCLLPNLLLNSNSA